MLLFFKFKHSITTWLWFRATWLQARWLSGDLTVNPLQDMSFDRLLLHYLSLSKKSLSIDCYVSIPRTLRNLFRSIVSSVPLALQGISFNRLLRQYPSHSQESLSIDCRCDSLSRTLRNFFQSIVSSVSLTLIGVSFNRLFRQYPSHS